MDDHSAVRKPLSDDTPFGLFVNGVGKVVIIHHKPLQSDIQWIEYDRAANSFSIVCEDGCIQDLGLKIDKKIQENLMKASEVTFSHMADKKVHATQNIILICKEY